MDVCIDLFIAYTQELAESEEDILGAISLKRPAAAVCPVGQYQRAAAQNKASTILSTTNKRKTLERGAAEASSTPTRSGGDRNKADLSLRKARKRRSTDRSLHNTAVSF